MKTKSILSFIIFSIFIFSNCYSINKNSAQKLNSRISDTSLESFQSISIDVIVDITDTDITLEISDEDRGLIVSTDDRVVITYYTRNRLQNSNSPELEIQTTASINTSLEPVEIPPKRPGSSRYLENNVADLVYLGTHYLPDLEVKNYYLDIKLINVKSERSIDRELVHFRAFDPSLSGDLLIKNAKLIYSNPYNVEGTTISCTIENNNNEYSNNILKKSIASFYLYDNRVRRYLGSRTIAPLQAGEKMSTSLWIRDNLNQSALNNVVLIVIDENNDIDEYNEENNAWEIHVSETLALNSKVNVYPNAFKENITFSFDTKTTNSSIQLDIYDQRGKMVSSKKYNYKNNGTQTLEYHNSNLLPGIYYYTISIDNKKHTGTIIKK
ncbi:T9SS type A sorting domain-containing protein [Aquimarina sp. 2201CG14-23]|uniref:T9SS type A sorting domain-containing protein n=1 Tax=Aquimarina mycalae TaxID=3040073 RepID=UPI00247815DF|nr:T9SS type A sorting domain-containing protein [Aquimarina sp. 2201CG14-23]MDH7446498.1 T9SS type A sorting domain-containing protein [Aquimarina sp. 2201CG14-23]